MSHRSQTLTANARRVLCHVGGLNTWCWQLPVAQGNHLIHAWPSMGLATGASPWAADSIIGPRAHRLSMRRHATRDTWHTHLPGRRQYGTARNASHAGELSLCQ